MAGITRFTFRRKKKVKMICIFNSCLWLIPLECIKEMFLDIAFLLVEGTFIQTGSPVCESILRNSYDHDIFQMFNKDILFKGISKCVLKRKRKIDAN